MLMVSKARRVLNVRSLRKTVSTFFLLSILVTTVVAQEKQGAQTAQPVLPDVAKPSRTPQVFKEQGVAVDFSIEPIGSNSGLMEATEARIKFRITETVGGKPLSNLRPIAWIDSRQNARPPVPRECREKVQDLLQANFARKAVVDLNSYFILALNNEPNISVIDPLSSVGTTKLYTLVALSSPGEDWLLSRDRKWLYVSMPLVNKVAVVDVANWKVIANIDAGSKPARLSLQNDERYLWVGNNSDEAAKSGVTVIDTEKLQVAANIATGAGHHEIGFDEDDRYAFITNKQDGTLTVVDIRKLAKLVDLNIGLRPTAVAFSSLSKAIYIANEGSGEVVAVDSIRHSVLTRIRTQPGLQLIRFMPGGRFGFATNNAKNTVSIFDVSTNQLIHTVPVGPSPNQITFTNDFAYVRSNDSEFVTMINLTKLTRHGEVALSRFPGGQKAPRDSAHTSLADSIIPAPEPGAVLAANPADKMIYFYTEGMAAPMGSFQNYRRDPRAILVLDNSLRETAPGVYSTTIKLPRSGEYNVPLLLDSPRLVNCFQMTVDENPALPKEAAVPIKVELVSPQGMLKVGEKYQLRLRVVDAISNKTRSDLKDLGVLIFLAPGIWQQREWAKVNGEGLYEMTFVPPDEGLYYVYVQVPSLEVKFNSLFPFQLQATK
jgi:YVTN family beta-propeller protein